MDRNALQGDRDPVPYDPAVGDRGGQLAIIKRRAGTGVLKACPQDQLPVLCRVIHTTADFSYKESLYFSEGAVSKGPGGSGLRIPIITDTTMAASGINETAAAARAQVRCFIGGRGREGGRQGSPGSPGRRSVWTRPPGCIRTASTP